MGVRGLTSFIAHKAELYLQPYELHDCNLVIDGDNLACNLYKDASGTCSAFGGDYDDFYRAVMHFFHVLAECNVNALVLMDGGYEQRKLRTVGTRLRGKIAVIKRINPCGSVTVFPLLLKEVFVDAVRDSKVPLMRCIFEADEQLAALSRKLNCPVLSYDSDFYIHNVHYIPLITLTVKAHTKLLEDRLTDGADQESMRNLRRQEAKQLEKRTKAQRILHAIPTAASTVEKRNIENNKTYKYLDCCIYKIENLIARGSLSKEKLPLFAALLGNDYIARSSFNNFFGARKGHHSRKLKLQQKRIKVALQWLKHETVETALQKIVSRLKLNQRESLLAQVNEAICGYSNERCHSYDYFLEHYINPFGNFLTESLNEYKEAEILSINNVNCKEYVFEDEEEEQEEVLNNVTHITTVQANREEKEDEEEEQLQQGEPNNDTNITSEDECFSDSSLSLEKNEKNNIIEEKEESNDSKAEEFPSWFLEKLYSAQLPRFFVDLLHLRKYINSPQIEHFPYNDCHEIALPILRYIFSLLHNAKDDMQTSEAGNIEEKFEFTYLTRDTSVTNIKYSRYKAVAVPQYSFDPRISNPLLLLHVFENIMDASDIDEVLAQLQQLPTDLQLYFLALIYWLQKSQHCNLLHLHALIICLVVLRTIDSKIPPERDLYTFQKRFGKIIKKERQIRRDKEAAQDAVGDGKNVIKEHLQTLSIPERISYVPKSDCFLVQDNLLKHFHIQEIFKKKYDLFSTIVLHAFAEFQSVVFQMYALNALLSFPFLNPRMSQLYCGVFLYNIYDLLRDRVDVRYYVKNFIFQDSQMMFDFYNYLLEWCIRFIPLSKREQLMQSNSVINKKILKKRRQAERKQAAKQALVMAQNELSSTDLNNKYGILSNSSLQ